MAYYLTYILAFNSPVTEQVYINMHRKDVVPAQVTKLKCTQLSKSFLNGSGDGADGIISTELNFSFWLPDGSTPTFKDFIVSFHDEWYITVTSDGQTEFIGFITPGEGTCQLRDKPYELSLSATDNLGLVKSELLRKENGDSFTGENKIVDYVAACLFQTSLNLNIRLYSSIYDASMQDRFFNDIADTWNQAMLDYRTFQTDPTTFMNCYDVLTQILEGYQLHQWQGEWVIMRNGEMNINAGPQTWYTLYDPAGTIIGSGFDTITAALIGKNQVLHPKAADQEISAEFAVKSVKSTYMYDIWPEIPLNNTFDRGTVYSTQQFPGPPPYTEEKATIDDWLYGITNPTNGATNPPNGMLPTMDPAYRKITRNQYGVEQLREIFLERTGGSAGHRFLRAGGIPVSQFDRGQVTLDYRTSQGGTGTRQYLMIMLEQLPGAGAGNGYRLDNGGAAPVDGVGHVTWVKSAALKLMAKSYQVGEDANQYTTFTIDLPAFPIDGTLYFCFLNYDPPVGRNVSYKNFSFTYYPTIAGSGVVKGDYWNTEQTADYKDVIADTHYISDSPKKVIKGALLNLSGALTTRTWYRQGEGQGTKDYKEILNIGRYNQNRRRMWKVKGTFGGTAFYDSATQNRYPIGLHRHFVFTLPSLNGIYFQLVPPITIDYAKGEINATFREAFNTADQASDLTGNKHEFKYIF